jgi:hypothetical protein
MFHYFSQFGTGVGYREEVRRNFFLPCFANKTSISES